MKVDLLSTGRFDEYYQRVREKADAPHLNINIILDAARDIVLDSECEEIIASTRLGVYGNACWVRYPGHRIAYFTYHHHDHDTCQKTEQERRCIAVIR